MSHSAVATLQSEATGEWKDRRGLPRVAVDLPIALWLDGLGSLPATTSDLSVGGLCCRTECQIAVSGIHAVSLELPSGILKVRAEGCWQVHAAGDNAVLTGVRFSGLTQPQVEGLWDMVHATAKRLTGFLAAESDLGELGLEEIMDIAHATRFRRVQRGRCLYRQASEAPGEPPGEDSIFVVLNGTVELESVSWMGSKVVLDQLGPGRLFGGVPMLTDLPHGETALALTDVGLLEISRGSFETLRRCSPPLAFRLSSTVMACHAKRLQAALLRVADTRSSVARAQT